MGHKSAYAEEERAPTSLEQEKPRRRMVASAPKQGPGNTAAKETLIVVSKLKAYVKDSGDMNTSGDVPDVLSDYVRLLVNQATENARREGRKTLMGKDFSNLKL
jgi:histone H3/H4